MHNVDKCESTAYIFKNRGDRALILSLFDLCGTSKWLTDTLEKQLVGKITRRLERSTTITQS